MRKQPNVLARLVLDFRQTCSIAGVEMLLPYLGCFTSWAFTMTVLIWFPACFQGFLFKNLKAYNCFVLHAGRLTAREAYPGIRIL